MDSTIDYYDDNSTEFIYRTINMDINGLYDKFEKEITPGCSILDLGCGSGRDSKYFKEKGYIVTAVDPSIKMCESTKAIADILVIQNTAQEIEFYEEFEAVWACASLLHIPYNQLNRTLLKIVKSLKNNGILYASWKKGNGTRCENGRIFYDMDEMRLKRYLSHLDIIEKIEVWESNDDYSNTKWINMLVKKNTNKKNIMEDI